MKQKNKMSARAASMSSDRPELFAAIKKMEIIGPVFFRNFKQYKHGPSNYGNLGRCTLCGTICVIRKSSRGNRFLVNSSNALYHRIYNEHGGSFKCNVPQDIITSDAEFEKKLKKINKTQKRLNIQEIPIERAKETDLVIIDDIGGSG